MSDGVLSQEEIDALLRSNTFGDSGSIEAPTEPAREPSFGSADTELTAIEKDAVGEVANIIMGSAATALSTLLERKVEITTPTVQITDPETFRQDYPLPYLLVNVEYITGLKGANVLIIRETDALVMVDLMMGGTGETPPADFDDMHLSAISEAMNQMMGSASTAVSTIIKDRVEITPPTVERVNFATDQLKGSMGLSGQILVKVSFMMKIEGLIDSEIMQLIPLDLAKSMVKTLMDEMDSFQPVEESLNSIAPALEELVMEPDIQNSIPYQAEVDQAAFQQPAVPIPPAAPVAAASALTTNYNSYGQPEPQRQTKPMPDVAVQPVQFAPLQAQYGQKEATNIDLILDVPLQITVELGRSKKTIREILALGSGSVIELDKLAGEPVDLLVNGKLLAKGEVVVIDENFGIRVSEIISPIDRVSNLQ